MLIHVQQQLSQPQPLLPLSVKSKLLLTFSPCLCACSERQPQWVQQSDVIPHPTGFALAAGPRFQRNRQLAVAFPSRFNQRAVSALRGAAVPHRAAGKEAAHPTSTLRQVNNDAPSVYLALCFIWAPGCQSRRDTQSRFE
jgi:hypothetical protein